MEELRAKRSEGGSRPTLAKRSHPWLDARNLTMCRLIARKIRRQPSLYRRAVDTLERWRQLHNPPPPALLEWAHIMRRSEPNEVLRLLTEQSERGNRLRQSDPFCGILTRSERRRILRAYEKG
jgi:hypothetical protein